MSTIWSASFACAFSSSTHRFKTDDFPVPHFPCIPTTKLSAAVLLSNVLANTRAKGARPSLSSWTRVIGASGEIVQRIIDAVNIRHHRPVFTFNLNLARIFFASEDKLVSLVFRSPELRVRGGFAGTHALPAQL